MSIATSLFTDPDWSVTASFNAFAGGFVDANLQSFGWTYTAQTGDIDPSTVAAPALNAYAGFRVYKSNDGLTDYYLRLEYGNNAYGGRGGVALKVRVGTGVDGSGNLTGQVGTEITLKSAALTGTYRSYMSGTAGRVMMVLNESEAPSALGSGSVAFAVGRTVDTSGSPSADGVEFYFATSQSTNFGQQFLPFTGTIPANEASNWICAMTRTNPAVIGADTLIGIPQSWDAAGLKNPSEHVGIHDQTTLTPGSTVAFTLYGASKTYLITGNTGAISGTNFRPLWRYD